MIAHNEALLRTVSSFSLDELKQMQDEVRRISVPDVINELMDDILCALRKSGIHVSDRKYFNYAPIAQAKAWLDGSASVEAHHLLTLKNYLWTTPDEVTAIEQILTSMCENPMRERIQNVMGMTRDIFDDLSAGKDNPRAMTKFRSEIVRLYDMACDLENSAKSDADKQQTTELLVHMEETSKKAHDLTGFTYAPLSEIKKLI